MQARLRRSKWNSESCRHVRQFEVETETEHEQRPIGLVEAGSVSLGGLVTERHGLDGWADAFAGLTEQRGLKIVIEPNA